MADAPKLPTALFLGSVIEKKEVASGQRPESRRGKFAPVYERVYNHYATRLGLGIKHRLNISHAP